MNDTTAAPISRTRPTPRPVANLLGFCGYAISRFLHDDGQQRAAALTFTSLLAMVPLLAVSFAIFAAFPAYESLKGRVQSFLFEQFVPSVGAEVQGYLEQFTAQTGQLTAVGIVFLAVSAVMLLMTISSTFNRIWKVKQTRGVISRLLVFWAVLTLTPMLFGASISLSSYLFTVARASGVENVTGNLTRFAFVIPFLLQTAGLMVLYLVMPNFPVRRRDAMIGGLVAGIMLDLLKRGFGLYVTNFPTYETIYGAMATVPIFLMWVYFSWMVVIFGAEVTAALPEWRHGSRNPRQEGMTPLRKLSGALAVLNALHRASLLGETLSERRLTQTTRVGPQEQGWATERLLKKQYITRTDKNGWVLSRDLSQVDLATLYTDLGLDLGGRLPDRLRDAAWLRRFAELKTGLSASQQEIFATDLKSLLAPANPSSEPLPDEDHEEDEDGKPGFKLYARVLGLIGLGTLAQGS